MIRLCAKLAGVDERASRCTPMISAPPVGIFITPAITLNARTKRRDIPDHRQRAVFGIQRKAIFHSIAIL